MVCVPVKSAAGVPSERKGEAPAGSGLLTERLGPGLKKGLAVFSETVALLFSVVILFYGGMKITDLAMGQMTSSLGLPVGFFYAVLPVSGVLCVVYTGLNLWEILKTGREG